MLGTGTFPKLLTQSWKPIIVYNVFAYWSVNITLPGNEGTQSLIILPDDYPCRKLCSKALRMPEDSILLASTEPRFFRQTASWWNTIHHSIVSTVSESSGGFTPLQPTPGITHADLRLVCRCMAMETHFRKLLTHSCCADVASTGGWEHSIPAALTVAQGRSSRADIPDLMGSSAPHILLLLSVYGDCMAWFYAPVSNGCGWHTWAQ